MGRSAGLTNLVHGLYTSVNKPLVIDADGLNAFSEAPSGLDNAGGPRILTPHPGEFDRLAPEADGRPRHEQKALAQALAKEKKVVVLLKGHPTFITDGMRHAENTTGNPGLATGGTGDVLTGVVTALVCQGLSPFDAAVLGAHVHGLAGDLAAAELGQVAMIASDLLRFLPRAFCQLSS
jgi:NAD(P)H-hydrate epimerase